MHWIGGRLRKGWLREGTFNGDVEDGFRSGVTRKDDITYGDAIIVIIVRSDETISSQRLEVFRGQKVI